MADRAEAYSRLVAHVRQAVDELEALMRSDAWDVIPPTQQRALREVTKQMRAEIAPLEEALRPEPFSDED
ncbi:MAG TPA: hypothetical protein VIO84_05075 [Candidatus Dormibacteraeota bacterium]|jgi:TRAP-type C4-dicarboxylate transport system substrate-binding protein